MFKTIGKIFVFLLMLCIVPGVIYNFKSTYSRTQEVANTTQYEEIFYTDVVGKDAEKNILRLNEDIIEKLPVKVKESIVNGGWAIYITEGDDLSSKYLTAYRPDSNEKYSLEGVTIPIKRLIVLKYTENYIQLKSTLAHELGHAVNYEYANICNGSEFFSLFKNSAYKNTLDDYHKNNIEEFFAEVFKEKITENSSDLKIDEEISEFFEDLFVKDSISTDTVTRLKESTIGGYRMIFGKLKAIVNFYIDAENSSIENAEKASLN